MVSFFKPVELAERDTPDVARQRLVLDRLTAQRKALEADKVRLSRPANQFHLNKLKEFEAKFSREIVDRGRDIEREFKKNNGSSRAYKIAILRYFQLKQQQSALLQRAAQEKRRNALFGQALAGNRNYFHPFAPNPRSVFGTEARTTLSRTSRRIFRNPLTAFPCVQRAVRREVMFAKRHGGKAHRGKRRFNPLSHIGC